MTISRPASQPPGSPGYSDAQAMDDIQALLTSPSRPHGEGAVGEVAEIVQRTGRSLATPRLFRVSQDTGYNGLPRAVINAEDTVIRAAQNPDTGAISVAIMTTTSHDEQRLQVEVNGRQLMPPARDTEVPGPGPAREEAADRDPADGGAS